jgi:hypothetical protein
VRDEKRKNRPHKQRAVKAISPACDRDYWYTSIAPHIVIPAEKLPFPRDSPP